MVPPGISFQFRLPLSLIYCEILMSMNVLVLSYLIVSRKQLLIQHDTMNTKVGCHLGIVKQFLQHFSYSNEIKNNNLSRQNIV